MEDTREGYAELQKRIAELESGSRKLQLMCTLLLIMGSLALYENFQTKYQVLDPNGSVNVRDQDEQPRAILHASDFDSALTIYDEENNDRVMLAASRTGSGLTLRDDEASQRIILRVNDGGPEMLMTDERGAIVLSLGVGEHGPRLLMQTTEGIKVFDSSDPGFAEPTEGANSASP